MQVLSLTPEQLNTLPPKEREQILQLVSLSLTLRWVVRAHRGLQRRQFGGGN